MDKKKEELIFARHLEELAKSAYYKGICTYTSFLGLNEISMFHGIYKDLPPVPYSMFGGIDKAERVRICFHGNSQNLTLQELSAQEFYADYPICRVEIRPGSIKFAETLTHRDYLGAVLNLGIDRSTTGDILIREAAASLYCDTLIAPFLCENLIKIRHTAVSASIAGSLLPSGEESGRSYETIHAFAASLRLDALVSAAFHTSRSSIADLAPNGRVFVNGRETLQNSCLVKPGDIISVRGFGKFILKEQGGLTKKGRISITLEKYK